MDLQSALDRRSQVTDFQRRHHSKLVTLLFSDIVGSTKLSFPPCRNTVRNWPAAITIWAAC